jgi:hypothetical protein
MQEHPKQEVLMIGYFGFHEAYHRLLAAVHGERATMSASIYQSPAGQFCVVVPDFHLTPLTEEEYWAARRALVLALRVGDIDAIVEGDDGLPKRVELWYWYPHPTPDELHRLVLRNQEGQPILLDRGQFEAWLSTSNVLEVLSSRAEAADAQEAAAELPGAEALTTTEPTRRGRRRKYDWEAFYREIIRVANEPDGLPEIQADLETRMTEWCEANWDEVPVESMIRTHVSMVYGEVRKGRK